MAISSAVQRGSFIYVYDERGIIATTIPGEQLHGFTSTTVSVRRGSFVYVYNERGGIINTIPA